MLFLDSEFGQTNGAAAAACRIGEMHRVMRAEMGNGGVADANVFRVTRDWLRMVPLQLADPR